LIKVAKTHLEDIWLDSADHSDYQSLLHTFFQQITDNIQQIHFYGIGDECVLDHAAHLSGKILDEINPVEGKPLLNLSEYWDFISRLRFTSDKSLIEVAQNSLYESSVQLFGKYLLNVNDIAISSSATIDFIYEKIVTHFSLNSISVIDSLKGSKKLSQLFLHYVKKCLQISSSKKSLTPDE
jgi:hypothetical protein